VLWARDICPFSIIDVCLHTITNNSPSALLLPTYLLLHCGLYLHDLAAAGGASYCENTASLVGDV